MNSTPAHKQTDPDKQPGQIINKIKTLDQYIAVKKRQIVSEDKKKLSFEEWWADYKNQYWPFKDVEGIAHDAWCIGQENK